MQGQEFRRGGKFLRFRGWGGGGVRGGGGGSFKTEFLPEHRLLALQSTVQVKSEAHSKLQNFECSTSDQ